MSKLRILIFTGYYKPGFKGGGPIKSIANIVDALKNDYTFDIVTLDRDLNDLSSYKDIKTNQWNKLEDGTNVYYTSPDKTNIKTYLQLIRSYNYQIIYLNSLYSKQTRLITILSKLRIINSNILIAPRGEVEAGALKLKSRKKALYLKINKMFNTYKNVYWHATNLQEKQDIKKYINTKEVFVASNISDKPLATRPDFKKKTGEMKGIFISRISPKKNVLLSIKALKNVIGDVNFDIYGPIEDENYFHECQRVIEELPSNIRVEFKGEIHPDHIQKVIIKYHFFIFPTLGENYGHVIYEALNSKVPVITTENVPEDNLYEKNIGFNIGYKENDWIEILQQCVNMTSENYDTIQKHLELNSEKLKSVRKTSIVDTKEMFNDILKANDST